MSKWNIRSGLCIVSLFFTTIGISQNIKQEILESYDQFQKVPTSNVYLHLNKSIFALGESIGFTAYVYDHKKQQPSDEVKNLYCQILDSNRVVIKEKLLKIDSGLATDSFEIDSLFVDGNYSIRGFTNWMKNFESPEFFESSIKVLTSSKGLKVKPKSKSNLDLQLLPEGGHLLENVLNIVGISLKTEYGNSVDDAIINVLENGKQISTVSLNENGHGRFSIFPKSNYLYQVELLYNNTRKLYDLPEVENEGITMSVNQVKERMFVELKTNENTLKEINKSNETFILTVNGNNQIRLFETSIVKPLTLLSLNLSELQSGVNQVTLLNAKKQIIAQRLLYNYFNPKFNKIKNIDLSKSMDTIIAKIDLGTIDIENLSISVLPTNNISVDYSQSIFSKFKLQPYIKGTIKNPRMYMNSDDLKVQYAMDNLLLCQGWRMYEWSDIFNLRKTYRYTFEDGINVTANLNDSEFKEFMIFPNRNTNSTIVEMEGDKNFAFGSFFPTEGEKLRMSAIDSKGKSEKPKLYLQFTPRTIPDFSIQKPVVPFYRFESLQDIEFKPFSDNTDKLDAITLTVQKEGEREQRIKDLSRGRVEIFDDNDRRSKFNIIQYLNRNGFQAQFSQGTVTIVNNRFGVLDAEPLIVINEVLYRDPNVLIGFDMSIIDYIEFDFSGLSQYGRAPGGLINIKTDPRLAPFNESTSSFSSYEIPLTFSLPSKFYRPTYYSYSDDFFNKLGIIDWQGTVPIVEGVAEFKMPYLGKEEMEFVIQGWSKNGQLIDQVITVRVSDK